MSCNTINACSVHVKGKYGNDKLTVQIVKSDLNIWLVSTETYVFGLN